MSAGDLFCKIHKMMPCACYAPESCWPPRTDPFKSIPTTERPNPMTERYPRFNELLTLMKTTHDAKGADYEGNGRPYENIRTGEDWGVEPWKMAMMRVGEKLKRLQSYAQKGSLNNESAFDSLLDIAVLSIIGYVLLEESKGMGREEPKTTMQLIADDLRDGTFHASHPTDKDGYHL